MIWLYISFAILIYIMIGGFFSGMFERELDTFWIFFWPVGLICITLFVIAKLPVKYGKKFYNKFNKWFEDHI